MRLAMLAVPVLALTITASVASAAGSAPVAGAPPACAVPASPSPGPGGTTTITTIEQAYDCVFAHYYDASALDDRTLLTAAFAGFTRELDRLGLDRPDANAPVLTGNRAQDLAAFGATYQRVLGELPPGAKTRQQLAAATMTGMLQGLDDNHVHWDYAQFPPGFQPGDEYGLGIVTSPGASLMAGFPQEALPPLFVTTVDNAGAGLRPGDVIVAVDGAAPFVDGQPDAGVASLLSPQYPDRQAVALTVRRPATGRTWTVTLAPALFRPAQTVTATLLDGDVADVALSAFAPDAAKQAIQDITGLEPGRKLRGVILDLRGNEGGSPAEVAGLLGAFEHGTAYSYDCTTPDRCSASYPDASVALLHLPLVVLTDRDCVSACDAFSDAVKDLRLGSLVGTRTGGIVAGPAQGYLLDDNSLVIMPSAHELGAGHETVNGIGVAPDYDVPLTASELSAGKDADLATALTLLGN
jgi:carboxyl-terminal processing protease